VRWNQKEEDANTRETKKRKPKHQKKGTQAKIKAEHKHCMKHEKG